MAVVYGANTVTSLNQILMTKFTSVEAYAFMTFALLYSPCIAAVGTLYKESNSAKFTLKSVLFQSLVAWIAATLVNVIGNLLFM